MAAESRQTEAFSRLFPIEGLGDNEVLETIEATAGERAVLVRRFELLALERLSARFRLRRLEGQPLIWVAGDFEAEVSQACVVTLEPLPNQLAGSFSLLFSLSPEAASDDGEIVVDLDAADPPEPVPPGGINLGEILAEQLALALDSYPRAEGARLEQTSWAGGPDAAPAATKPFAVLETLKKSLRHRR